MQKRVLLLIILSVIFLILFTLPIETTFADDVDGTYEVPFEMKEAGSENTSIADGYFSKPANVVIKDGTIYIQLTITNSEWVKSLSGPFGESTVIGEDKDDDTRTIKLQVGDLSEPVKLNMHVVVPEEIAGMPYDHEHTVRAVFDTSEIPINIPSGEEMEVEAKQNQSDDLAEDDDSSIGLYMIVIMSSIIVVFIIYKIIFARK